MEADRIAELLSPDKFRLVLQLVVPGFVAFYARSQLVPNRRLALSEAILGYIALSLVFQALVFPLSSWIDTLKLKGIQLNAWTLGSAIILPAAFGFLLGVNARQGWVRKLLGKAGINLSHPIDAAWDWRFAGCEECWVLAVLKDGTKWAGHLGPGSFMSTDRDERDLYIEHVYQVDKENVWTPKGSGVWIAQGELQSLEIWPYISEVNSGGTIARETPTEDGRAPTATGETAG